MIAYLDLKKINAPYERPIIEKTQRFLSSGRYILGTEVSQFEENFAQYCGSRFTIGVGNGLDALGLIFKGYIQIGKLRIGDEILVSANTYIASILALIHAGLSPKLVDTNLVDYNMDLDSIQKAISPKTRGILMVHLYGQISHAEDIIEFCQRNQLLLVEDAAQAHGARSGIHKAGSIGNAAGFSFYPGKNLGALGDGGAITTSDEALYHCIKSLRNYGSSQKYHHHYKGINSRLDEWQAAILNLKLKNLDADNEKRRHIAKQYLNEIQQQKIILPQWDRSPNHIFHIFAIRVQNRDAFQGFLYQRGIETLIHYPIAPHLQEGMKEFAHLKLPISEQIHREIISIPCHPMLEQDEINYIIKTINEY